MKDKDDYFEVTRIKTNNSINIYNHIKELEGDIIENH
jgi:hypothetical protein